jgi:hypothetical protein
MFKPEVTVMQCFYKGCNKPNNILSTWYTENGKGLAGSINFGKVVICLSVCLTSRYIELAIVNG